jgi:hypothetical protein
VDGARWDRWDVEFAMPAREVVRGVYALSRGMGLEALLADEQGATAADQLEQMFRAYATGLIRARTATARPAEGRLP